MSPQLTASRFPVPWWTKLRLPNSVTRSVHRHIVVLPALRRERGFAQPEDKQEQRWSLRLASASSTIYNVGMAKRAMQEATFLILTALAAGSQHGYGIITDVAQISQGRVRLRAGTLYTALDRLRTDELIVVDREEIVENRLRRYYRLTPKGSDLLAAEAARLQIGRASGR